MLTTPVASRATFATRVGCVLRGLVRRFQDTHTSCCREWPKSSILQPRAHRKRDQCYWAASLHEQGHCPSGDPLHYHRKASDCQLFAESVLNWKHSQITFVHELLEWTLVDQSPERSETECFCVDFERYKIFNDYKLHPRNSHLRPS